MQVALGRGGGPVLDPKQESHTAGFPQHKDQGGLRRSLNCSDSSVVWRNGLDA